MKPGQPTRGAPIEWQQHAADELRVDAALRRQWADLNAGNREIPVLGIDIVAAAIATLGTGREKLLVGRRESRVVAMGVFAPQFPMRWATFQPSQLPLGALVTQAGEGLEALGASLMRGPLSPALILSFTQMDPLAIAPPPEASTLRSDPYIRTAWIDVVGTFDAYWAERGKNLRQNMRKQRHRLAADGTLPVMQTWRAPEQMAAALARYGALESQGWKAAEGTAIHIDNAQGRFYRALFEDAAARGQALIYEYLLDAKTVAMNLCIHAAGTLVILKTTYDESVKPLSPAFLLQEDQLRSIFESREFHRIEYYGRVMDWHTKWTAASRTLFHATQYRWPAVRRLADARRRTDAPPEPPDPARPSEALS